MKKVPLVAFHLILPCLFFSACGRVATEGYVMPETPIQRAELEEDSLTPNPFPAATKSNFLPIEAPGKIVESVKTDLTKRLDIPKDQILVVEAKAVSWPDASLGCPQPGMVYVQVTTPGYQIVLEASGEQHSYHTDQGTNIVLCKEDSLPSFPFKPGEIDDGKPWMPVEPIESEAELPRR